MTALRLVFISIILIFMTTFTGCGGGGGGSGVVTTSSSSSGAAQKGPFLEGSTVKAYKLNSLGERSSTDIVTTATSDKSGHFSVDIPWSGATEFEVTGSYFDEVTGGIRADGNLTAVVDITAGVVNNININIFTHIAAQRAKELMRNGSDVKQAKSEATNLVKNMFSLELDNNSSLEDLDLTTATENAQDNAQLLKVSASILSSENPEDILNSLIEDVKDDGELDDNGAVAFEEIATNSKNINMSLIGRRVDEHTGNNNAPKSDELLKGKLPLGFELIFKDQLDVEKNTQIDSNEIILSGFEGGVSATVNHGILLINHQGENSSLSQGGGSKVLYAGDIIALKNFTSSRFDADSVTTLSMGGKEFTFRTHTKADPDAHDREPATFDLGKKLNVEPSSQIKSDEIVVGGLSIGEYVDISVEGGRYSINGANPTSSQQSVTNGDRVRVFLTSSDEFLKKTSATLTIGGVSDEFVVITRARDVTPNVITLPTKVEQPINQYVETDFITLDGFEGDLPLTVENGEVFVDGENGWFTHLDTVSRLLRVKFRQRTSSDYATEKVTTITLGGVVSTFKTITMQNPIVLDLVPNRLDIPSVYDVDPSSSQEAISSEVAISGISQGMNITVEVEDLARLQVNGGSWVKSATVKAGDTIRVKLENLSIPNHKYSVPIYFSNSAGVTKEEFGVFNIYTTSLDTTPDPIDFGTILDANLSHVYYSNLVTISGLGDGVEQDVILGGKGGSYSISVNGTAYKNINTFTDSKVKLKNGDTVKVSIFTSSVEGEKHTMTLNFGDYVASFIVTNNKAPIFRNRPDFSTILSGDSVSFTPDVVDTQDVTFSLENAPSWMSVDTQTGAISGVASGNYHDIKLIATDSGGLSSFITFDINANVAPSFTSGNFKQEFIVDNKSENPRQFYFNFKIADTDNPISNLTTFLRSEITESRVEANAVGKGFTDSRILCDISGNCVATISLDFYRDDGVHPSLKTRHYITVSDGDKNVTDYFDIWYAPVKPELSGDSSFTVNFASQDESAYQEFSFIPTNQGDKAESWTIQNKPSWATFNTQTGEFRGIPSLDDNGTYSDINITATNDRGSSSHTISITVVDPTPQAPFHFSNLVGVELNKPYESSVVVDWLEDGERVAISSSGYAGVPTNSGIKVNGQAGVTEVQNGDVVTVWHISSNQENTKYITEVTIGSFSSTFSTTTKADENLKLPLIVGAPTTTANANQIYSYTPQLSSDMTRYAPATHFAIENKPDWAEFNTTTGELRGIPTETGVYRRVKIIAYGNNGLDDIVFDITVANYAPNLTPEDPLSLENEDFVFTFADNQDWRDKVTAIEYFACYSQQEATVLEDSDYTLTSGRLELHVSSSDKASLHVPSFGGARVVIKADGYDDSETYLNMIEDGQYAVKATLSSNGTLSESNINGATVTVTLANGLKFEDNNLTKSNFTLAEVFVNGEDMSLDGVEIVNVEYLTPTTATLTLSYNGFDFDTQKYIALNINSAELNVCQEVKTSNLRVLEEFENPKKDMLYPSDAGDGVRFGSAVDMDEDLVAVGSNGNKVYIFTKNSDGNFTQVDNITLPDTIYPHIQSVSLDNNHLVVAKNDANITGKVYLYHSGFGTQYNFKYDLTQLFSGLSNYGNFGAKVVVKKNLIAIYYGGTTSENAKVYLVEVNDDVTDILNSKVINLAGKNLVNIIEEAGLALEYDEQNDQYYIFAGSQVSGASNGQVEVFSYKNGVVTSINSFQAPNYLANVEDSFGQSIAVDKTFMAIGAPNSKKVYVYSLQGQTLSLIDVLTQNVLDFGVSVDIDSDIKVKVVVGTADSKAYSYIFNRYNDGYAMHESMLNGSDDFGARVAIDGVDVVYTILSNSDKGNLCGAALASYVWDDVSSGVDTTPVQFTFNDIVDATTDTYYMDEIIIIGINSPATLTITGGEYSLDGGSSWNTQQAQVTNQQSVIVRVRSASSAGSSVSATLTVGGVSDTFSVTTANSTPPNDFHSATQNLELSSDSFEFNYTQNSNWEGAVSGVYYKVGGSDEYVLLDSQDYTFNNGVFTLNISNSTNPCLHTAYQSGGALKIVANGYDDLVVNIPTVLGGEYEAKVKLSSAHQLVEEDLDGVTLDIELVNTLQFVDNILDSANFSLVNAPTGLTISSVQYVDQTHARVTLSFDGTDFDSNKEFAITISKDELNGCIDMTTNFLEIIADMDLYYGDINISVPFHNRANVPYGLDKNKNLSTFQQPNEGNVSNYLVGNEYWYMQYTHQSCNMSDRFIYETDEGKGLVNVSVNFDIDIVREQNITMRVGGSLYKYELFDDTNITSVTVTPAQNGTAQILHENGLYLLNYTPDSEFIGVEDMTLTVNISVDGCSISKTIPLHISVTDGIEYAMVSFKDSNTCYPAVLNGLENNVSFISSVELPLTKCDNSAIAYDYFKVDSRFIYEQNNANLYKTNPSTLSNTKLNDSSDPTQYILDNARSWTYNHIKNHVVTLTAFKIASEDPNNEEESIGAGTLPWSVNTDRGLYVNDDFIMAVSGDSVISNYAQDYLSFSDIYGVKYYYSGKHFYYVGYDGSTNGNGLYLNKACKYYSIFECDGADNISLYDVNQTEGLRDSDDFSIETDRYNNVYFFDNTNHNLWMSVGVSLDALSRTDATRLISSQEYISMKFKKSKSGKKVFYYAVKADGNVEIGYYSVYSGNYISLNYVISCNGNCTQALFDSKRIDGAFDSITKTVLKTTQNSGSFEVAKEKLYLAENTQSGTVLYEVSSSGVTEVTSINPASLPSLVDMKYIDGYLYILGKNNEDKNILLVLNTTDNSVKPIENSWDKVIRLHHSSIYKNDYNLYKIFYTTKEETQTQYIYNLIGYNVYKDEKTIIKTYSEDK